MKKQRIEPTSASDKFYDYCHYEYKPSMNFYNKLRPVNLLINSFDYARCKNEFYNFVNIIKKSFGLNNTVWGVKKVGNDVLWEFYFYNWQKKGTKINMSDFLKICKPFYTTKINPNENIPYFMFSVDITNELLLNKKLQGLHVYTDCSYFLDEHGMTLENHYNFYKPKKEIKELISNIKKSAMVDFTKIELSEILWPELIDCYSICRSRKRNNDAIYYSRINIGQFLFFLKKLNYPHELVSFIENNKPKLDHLYYDVGFDYIMENNKLKIIKSGYYGTF